MARHRGVIVGKVYSREANLTLDLRLDKKEMSFYCELPNGHVVSSKQANEVTEEVERLMARLHAIVWQPVIIVNLDDGRSWSNKPNRIDFKFSRCWVGQKTDSSWVKAGWAVSADKIDATRAENLYVRKGDLAIPGKLTTDETILPYKEETWAGLLRLEEGIGQLRLRLRELLDTSAGWEQIELVGRGVAHLLGDGR